MKMTLSPAKMEVRVDLQTIGKDHTAETSDTEQSAHDHEDTLLQVFRNHTWAVLWCIYALWIMLLSGYDNQTGGAVLSIPEFRKDFGSLYDGDYVLPAEWQSAYNGAPTASAVLGALGSSYIADLIGRKVALLIALLFALVGITVEMIAVTNAVFFAGKFINGFAVGGFTSIGMTYIGEVSPFRLRGILTSAAGFSIIVGQLIVSIIINCTGDVSSRWAYRAVFLSQYGVWVIAVGFLPFMPESPWWLLARGHRAKAEGALIRLGYPAEEIEANMTRIQLTLDGVRHETEGASFAECFRKTNLRRTIISVAPMAIQALCGIAFVVSYATYYIELAGYTTVDAYRIWIGIVGLAMFGNMCSWFLVDRVGRRSLSIYGLAILLVLLCLTGGLAVKRTPACIKGTIAFIALFAWAYNVTIGATAYVILVETATARLRAKTASIAFVGQNIFSTIWAFALPYLFNPNEANLGAKTAFIFAGLSVFCLIYLYIYQPETAGRSYNELDDLFIERTPAREFKAYPPR
ncbi:MFS hexose transporter [Penicillium atrosanguineum]|uniref:MFS hexose transporter n=1 Tax=Penicillium atrosanguineum TaxID=1132637 RepID=A0A9W9U582_9EURO|nr:MFS hexose transporter [Penicillium atrosanguineum]KAJ5142414.1 MFS hexose transporter [Penicillium atrosanguineum]KAJ5320722.1 MFS hexose transporter [Penicillium atrosanguineum]